MLKALFLFEIFTFLSRHFGHVGKGYDKKVMVNFKIYNSTDWTRIITIHILPNISKSKGNMTMKFGHLIEYKRNVFLEKLYAICCGEASTDPLLKNQN